ncbi:MAG: ABC transporter permease [Alphaproteobacteria bacterium]|nr:ABC transporter permease [Alphaproteobacteria bacterium]
MSGSAPSEASLFKILIQRRSVLICLGILAVFIFAAVMAEIISPHSPKEMSVRNRLASPDGNWLLGTDEFGRDVLTRLIYAGRVSLIVGVGVATLSSLMGIILGLLAGFFRKLDGPMSRFIDAMMAFPDILLAISLVAALGGSIFNVVLALSIVYAPRIARTVRASTLVIRELAFVEAAHALGTSTWRILVFHILRNMVSPIIVQATFIFAYAMLAEAGLSFLGVGINPDTPTWGTMINAGRQYIGIADWMILAPGIAITLCALSLQIVGDGLRDALDPRLSKEV